jgi:DMSO/TMAO reductase YedYZ molybdopterin-dependent catalytic subunit
MAVPDRPRVRNRGPLSDRWRSPIRGPWLTSVFGAVLLVGIPVEFVTGLLSYAAYNPKLAGNDPNPDHGLFGLYLFDWLTRPSWLFRVIEGVHVIGGLVLVPVVLAKLWSVMPKLFAWPAARTVARLVERVSLLMIVGGVIFEFSSGILDIDYFSAFRFDFYTGHFFGAWIFMAGFVLHVGLKLPTMVRSLRSRSLRAELRTSLAGTRPEPVDDELVAVEPAPPTISRRATLALVGGTSLAIFVLTAGENIGGRFRSLALLAPRNRSPGTGANHFPVNNTATSKGITEARTGPGWRVELVGARRLSLSRGQLLALPQAAAAVPITCTDGWSTGVQHWSGVRLADLAQLVGTGPAGQAKVESIDTGYGATFSSRQVHAGESLLALRVNGADLSLDHGFPARIIVPTSPGTQNIKWVSRITFVGID